MARVVLVHGAFNELWGPNELKARWLPAVRDGLWHHGIELEADDADKLIESTRAGIADALTDSDMGDSIAALCEAAGEATFDRTVDMIAMMTTEPDLRQRMQERVERLIGDDTRVVVAHSLGTAVSYTSLVNHPEWPIHTFVTLGSPLGVPAVFDSVVVHKEADGTGAWPGSVQRWVNVRAHRDKAASVSLAERFGPRVEECFIDNGHRAHAPEPYLNAGPTGAAVAEALTP
jgi:predicted alpha/beta hydrolase family esterase